MKQRAAVMMCLWMLGMASASAGSSSLIDAIKMMDLMTVRAQIKAGVDVNAAAADGTTALEWAVTAKDTELVDMLLAAGANVHATNRYGISPIWLAAESGNSQIMDRLLKAGADPNTTLRGGETVLMTAARTGLADVVHALVLSGAKVNVADAKGQTPLMWAAANGNAAAIRMLVEAGAEVAQRTNRPGGKQPPQPPAATLIKQASVANAFSGRHIFQDESPTGFSALLFAVRAGKIEAVKTLLYAGANVNDTLSDGRSALIVACANAHWELADLLLDRGADPNLDDNGWNALHQIVRTRRPHIGMMTPGPLPTGKVDSFDVIKKMIAKGVAINTRMFTNGMKDGQRNALIRTGATAFLLAAKNTDTEVMRVLLDAGADANIPTVENTTPLMVAAGVHIWNPGEDGGSLPGQEQEVVEALKICIEQGNDVNASNALGWTPLHGAAFRGVDAVAQFLVDNGAKLDAKNNEGWTALAIAKGLTYSDVYHEQPGVKALLVKLMTARGLSTEGHTVSPAVCLDCLQMNALAQNLFLERERKAEQLGMEIRATQLRQRRQSN